MANPITAMLIRPIMRRRNARKMIIDTPNGIQEERFVTIGGIPQWITIRGQSRNNPVLLFVHGGPGSSYIPFNSWLLDWEEHFTIVQWDQRGTGKTFQKNGAEDSGVITLNQLASDGLELTEYLLRQLNQEKVILLGSSVGSLIGLLMVRQQPDLFWAYVGANQNTSDQDTTALQLATAAAQKNGDRKGEALLKAMGDNPSSWTWAQILTMNKVAIKNSKDVPDMIYDLMLPALMYSPDYTMNDIKAAQKSMEFIAAQLSKELMAFNLSTVGYEFKVPFFIFQGEGDIITPVAPAKAYFDQVKAPQKEFVLIKNAGHLAEFANPDQFLKELIQRVLPTIQK